MLLGNVNDLVDDELLIRDQFGRMQSLSDDLEHVDVGKRLQRVGTLDLEDPGQETLKVNLRFYQGYELGHTHRLQSVRQEVQDRIQWV